MSGASITKSIDDLRRYLDRAGISHPWHKGTDSQNFKGLTANTAVFTKRTKWTDGQGYEHGGSIGKQTGPAFSFDKEQMEREAKKEEMSGPKVQSHNWINQQPLNMGTRNSIQAVQIGT